MADAAGPGDHLADPGGFDVPSLSVRCWQAHADARDPESPGTTGAGRVRHSDPVLLVFVVDQNLVPDLLPSHRRYRSLVDYLVLVCGWLCRCGVFRLHRGHSVSLSTERPSLHPGYVYKDEPG